MVLAAVGGWSGPEERELKAGLELADSMVNAAGGVAGRPVQLVFRDDSNDVAVAGRLAQELVRDRRVLAVIGHTRSDPTLVATKVYDGQMPVVVARFSSPDLAGVSHWVFEMVPTDSAYSAAVSRFAAAHRWKRAAVLFNNTARGRTTAEQFRKQFAGEVLAMDPAVFPAPLPGDLRNYVAFHRQLSPDMVYVPVGEPKEYIREAQLQGLRATVVGWDVWSSLTRDPALAGEFYYVAPFDLGAARPETRQFATRFQQAYGRAPGAFAALGYDALGLIAATAARTGADRKALRQGLAGLTPEAPYPGAIGPLSFNADGMPVGPEPAVLPLPAARPASTVGGRP